MAATEIGLCIARHHVSQEQIEIKVFIQLTSCWTCYRYDHNQKDCPEMNTKKCYECAATGHTFRKCKKKNNPKCLNCSASHRTLAASCPVRRQRIKEIRGQRNNNKKQFEMEKKTYCAVTKLGKRIPKLKKSETPILQLNSDKIYRLEQWSLLYMRTSPTLLGRPRLVKRSHSSCNRTIYQTSYRTTHHRQKFVDHHRHSQGTTYELQ